MDEDKEWVSQVLQGNKQAYAHLINKYKDKVYAILFRMVHQPQDAQDLTQECFIKAYNYLRSYDPTRNFSSWLYRIAINHCIDAKRFKLKKHQNIVEIDENLLSDGKSPESIYLKKEFASELRFLIDRLPEMYRIVLLLRYVDDLSYQEMSEILEVPVSSIQVRLHRAKQKLRQYFDTTRKGGKLHEMY